MNNQPLIERWLAPAFPDNDSNGIPFLLYIAMHFMKPTEGYGTRSEELAAFHAGNALSDALTLIHEFDKLIEANK
jgi:hypothetical protein